MESLLVHPETEEQLEAVKAVLNVLKIEFESKEETLPPRILKSFERGMAQYRSGQTISLDEFKEKHLFKK